MVAPIARFGSMYDLVDHLEFEGLLQQLTTDHAELVYNQVESAVQHLLERGLRHGDLAARNVLVFDIALDAPYRVHVKLADFGETAPGRTTEDELRALRNELHAIVSR